MHFRQEDLLAVHTLAIAGIQGLRDLAMKRGLEHAVDSMTRPRKEGKFWGAAKARANFLKHADRDPQDILTSFPELENDPRLMIASSYYELLGNPPTTAMRVFWLWYSSIHPDVLSAGVSPAMLAGFRSVSDMQHLPRDEQLATGSLFLEKALAQPHLAEPNETAVPDSIAAVTSFRELDLERVLRLVESSSYGSYNRRPIR